MCLSAGPWSVSRLAQLIDISRGDFWQVVFSLFAINIFLMAIGGIDGSDHAVYVLCMKKTQTQIAAECGASQSYVCEILNGNKTPSADMARRLEKATGISRLHWMYPNEFGEKVRVRQ